MDGAYLREPLQSHSARRSGHRTAGEHIDETTEDLLEREAGDLALAPSVHAVDTAAASEERKKLRRSVGRLDTAFLMLAAIIVLDTLSAVSSYGAQSFTLSRSKIGFG
jgi:hypothetical protein